MLDSIARTSLGDDVYGEDPTVRELEVLAADMLGKEAAMLVTSGTQGNQIAVLSHTQRGDGVIVEQESHIYRYETGAMTALAGIHPVVLKGTEGVMPLEKMRAMIESPDDIHTPMIRLVCLENPHNSSGGRILPASYLEDLHALRQQTGVLLHLDGARLFHAAVAMGKPVSLLADPFDSVVVCLSKGLCAPVGSILAGSQTFIDKARRFRKMLGGGMRQAGIIAAPGIIALKHMVHRLAEDHEHARQLAVSLSRLAGFSIDLHSVQTNMVYADLTGKAADAFRLGTELAAHNIKIDVICADRVRLVTHHGIHRADIHVVVETIARLSG